MGIRDYVEEAITKLYVSGSGFLAYIVSGKSRLKNKVSGFGFLQYNFLGRGKLKNNIRASSFLRNFVKGKK